LVSRLTFRDSRRLPAPAGAQPTLDELRQARGIGTYYHFNHIRAWKIRRDGSVVFGLEG